MANEIMSQGEIDTLMESIKSGGIDENIKALGSDKQENKNAVNRVKTAMARLWFAQENGMRAEEIYFRAKQLKDAAHAMFLRNHGYTKRERQVKVQKYFGQHPEIYQLYLWKRSMRRKNGC